MTSTSAAPVRRQFFVALLVVAIAINVVQFPAADRDANAIWQAVHQFDTSGFAELSYAEDPHIRFAFGPYRALAELAPGSTVIVPDGSPETVARLYGAGDAAAVRVIRDRDLYPLPAGFDPGPSLVASGEGGISGKGRRGHPWGVVLDAPDPRPADLRDAAEFLPALLAAGRRGEARGGARELVLFKWDDPSIPAEFDHRLLLVETSLLRPGPGTAPR